MNNTKLNKIHIKKFRALSNVEINFAEQITVICGKNGTSKSSILGIAAQIFSFTNDYTKGEKLDYQCITGAPYKSKYSEHFKISNNFDTPGSMDVDIEIYDGYTQNIATASLELMKRQDAPRPVVRKNSTVEDNENSSRNFTHPVIFLSLKRLYPIADRTYKVNNFEYLDTHKKDFISISNEILNRELSCATGTSGTISSAVVHNDNYDQNSVSAGEDNVGQIVMALMSFRKLKEEYKNFKGGLLLIDEADAALFPTAQINLLNVLQKECKSLGIQVVLTSHSPTMIQYAYEQNKRNEKSPGNHKIKTIYISNTYGTPKVMSDWSWTDIYADINTKTITTNNTKLPIIKIYFEDTEAVDFFSALTRRKSINKFTRKMSKVTLGCTNYINLIKSKVPEFSKNSIICLDADQEKSVSTKNYETIILLPGKLPPDQLIFEHLYNLPADDSFWGNELRFSREVFTNEAREVISEFGISRNKINLQKLIKGYNGTKKPREIFKRFYKSEQMQLTLRKTEKPFNPWRNWVDSHPDLSREFYDSLVEKIIHIMRDGYGVQSEVLSKIPTSTKG